MPEAFFPDYPLATDKVNDTLEVDDHPPHHNKLATAANWLNDMTNELLTGYFWHKDRLDENDRHNQTQDSRLDTLESAAPAGRPGWPPTPAGSWRQTWASTVSGNVTVTASSAVGAVILAPVDAGPFDGAAVQSATGAGTIPVRFCVYGAGPTGLPADLIAASQVQTLPSGVLAIYTFDITRVGAGFYWVGWHIAPGPGTPVFSSMNVQPPLSLSDVMVAPTNASRSGWRWGNQTADPAASLSGVPVSEIHTGFPASWLRAAA